MSLKHAAQHLSAHGRGPDTTLVHMSKDEVKSLNDLAMAAGGHLTINPHTGLPEAGFLSRMLPMIAGAGLMMVPGMQPAAAAMLVGGGTAVATGDIKKGIMAGLGAYGGAGIGSALTASGSAAAGTAAAPAAGTAGTTVAATTPAAPGVVVGPYASQAASQTASQAASQAASAPTAVSRVPLGPNPNPHYTDVSGNLVKAPPVQPVAPNSVMTGVRHTGNQMFDGLKSLGTEGGPTKFYENLGNVEGTFGPKTTLAAAAIPLLMPDEKKQEEEKTDSDPGQQYTFEANAVNPTPAPNPYGVEQKYYNQRYVPRAADGGMMASGGISDAAYNLGGYSDGGRLLRGPGDGVSDSIPAIIGKRQPARLADGEFVVPARIVSELGNGSTEAGARKLYAMMDRIQKARGKTVGKGKVAKNSRSERHLPA